MEESKLTGESKDIVLENISKLKEIFPDVFNEIYQVNLKLNSFGCQIMNIKRYSNYTSAVINYHVVK